MLAAVLTGPTRVGSILPDFTRGAGTHPASSGDEKEEGQMISDIFSMGGFFGSGNHDDGCGCFRRRDFHHGRRFFHRRFRDFDHHRGSLLSIRIL